MAATSHSYGSRPTYSAGSSPFSLNLRNMDSPPERPSSALARGVKITEFKGSRVNPEPVTIEESDILLEDYLSPRKLRDLTGFDDLEEVKFLEMKVDTRDTSLGNFGCHLPNLSQLRLNNSIITTVRDLGTTLSNLRILWMARCGLDDIDGISAMTSLQELYLAYNEINDISPISMLEQLRVLDLEGNNLDDISQVQYLAMCMELGSLTLEGNPVCVTPNPDEISPNYNYRAAVRKELAQLETLDDESLDRSFNEPRRQASVFEDDWKLIEEMLEEGGLEDSQDSLDIGRPGTAIRPTTGYRPGSALKQQVGRPSSSLLRPRSGGRPSSGSGRPSSRLGSGRPGSGSRPVSALFRPDSEDRRPTTASVRPNSTEEDFGSHEESSELTRGKVVCGNPSKALRARAKTPSVNHQVPALLAKHKYKPEKSYRTEEDQPDGQLKDILSELKEWKRDYRTKQSAIDSSKTAQVLRIDHDDAVDLSDNSLSSDDDSDLDELVDEDVLKEYNLTVSKPSQGARPKSTMRHPEDYRYNSAGEESPSSSYSSFNGRSPVTDTRSPVTDTRSPVTEVRTPPSPMSYDEEGRPLSGPVIGTRGRFKLDPSVDKTKRKVIDKQNPVIRTALHSPEKLIKDGPRGVTAQAALGPIVPKGRLRVGNVQLLPSRKLPSVPKYPTSES